jgi:uncharacterized protein (DUF934 family)
MPLLKEGRIAADPWIAVANGEPLPASGRILVSLERWQTDREALVSRSDPVGVRLASHQLAAEIGEDAPLLGLIALEFPSFRDGRAYSTARLLRERYRFRGEVRAVGNVLRDQLLFMHRCGFNAFEIADPAAADAWRKALAEISLRYQAAADRGMPVTRLRQMRRAAE